MHVWTLHLLNRDPGRRVILLYIAPVKPRPGPVIWDIIHSPALLIVTDTTHNTLTFCLPAKPRKIQKALLVLHHRSKSLGLLPRTDFIFSPKVKHFVPFVTPRTWCGVRESGTNPSFTPQRLNFKQLLASALLMHHNHWPRCNIQSYPCNRSRLPNITWHISLHLCLETNINSLCSPVIGFNMYSAVGLVVKASLCNTLNAWFLDVKCLWLNLI